MSYGTIQCSVFMEKDFIMKIMYTINLLGMGGAERIVVNYLIKLKEKGHDVVLLELYSDNTALVRELQKNNIKIIPACTINPTNLLIKKIRGRIIPYIITNKINRIINKEKPDIIHINGSADWIHSINYPKSRIFYTFHTDIDRDFMMRNKLHRNVLNKYVKDGMSIFVLNKKMLNDAKKHFSTKKIYYLPNGINISEIKKYNIPKNKLKQSLGIPKDSFVVGHVGRIHPVKNHEKIIDIFREVLKMKKNAFLLLIGDGEFGYIEKIKGLVKKYEIEDKVLFTGMREDATLLMGVFDVFIFPSIIEGFPLVTIEAQAQNIKSILSKSVTDEVICNSNCKKLDINESSKVWAEYCVNDWAEHVKYSIWEYDIEHIIVNLVKYYEKACGLSDGEANEKIHNNN